MRRLIVVGIFLNAALLFAIWHQLGAVAQGGGGAAVATMNGDINGDGDRDIVDAVNLLEWLFRGGPQPVPVACADGVGLTPEQAEILSHMSIVQLPTLTDDEGNVTETAKAIRFTGVNVQIVNGLGETGRTVSDPETEEPVTDPDSINGLGNLIVGYQGRRKPAFGEDPKTLRQGSHNIVVGDRHNYTSYGGLVVGYWNTISGPHASVSGGWHNTASGESSSVTGGEGNTASGEMSSVSGGWENTASGQYASVSGGSGNTPSGKFSSVSGGGSNTASGWLSSVSGGSDNKARGSWSSVSGGAGNEASGNFSSVSGGGGWGEGQGNIAAGFHSSILGGRANVAGDPENPGTHMDLLPKPGVAATITGGQGNVATEENQLVP